MHIYLFISQLCKTQIYIQSYRTRENGWKKGHHSMIFTEV